MKPVAATFFDLVRDQMPDVEARMRAGPGNHHPSLNLAVEHLLTSGGKRIRPALVLLAASMLGADPDRATTLAAAIEMLHTATLVHDDLIDGSTLRRGIPTINSQWTPGATVLTGDYIFARAASLAAQTDSLPVMQSFAETLMTIVNGEINQLFDTRTEDPRQDYFDRIYAKTASLFELAARGAALIAEASPARTQAIEQYGYSIGVAFQIIDDVLDFVGNQARVGKPLANDLRQGLITLPTLCYFEAHPDDPDVNRLLRGGELTEASLTRLVNDIRTSGAIDSATQEAHQAVQDGLAQLELMPGGSERQALFDLAQYVVRRSI